MNSNTLTIDRNFIIFDLETTGLDRQNDRILEFALIEIGPQGEVNRWSSLFNPEGPVRKTEIHGIKDSDVTDAPTFKEAANSIIEKISGRTLVAHNAVFDLAFLRSELTRAGWTVPFLTGICTLEASNYYLPELGRRKLKDCCDAAGIIITNQHRAFGDVEATAALMSYYLDFNKYPKPRDSDIQKINQGSPSNFRYDPKQVVNAARKRIANPPVKAQSDSTVLKEMLKLLDKIDLRKYIGLEIKSGYSSYIEKLIEFLEDGDIDFEESQILNELAQTYELSSNQVNEIHEALVTALAFFAQEDESVSQIERNEIKHLCLQLGFKETDSARFVRRAKDIKNIQLSQNTLDLPESWDLGEPLRIGDLVVFTGCEPNWREKMEKMTRQAGITVSSGVTKKTKLLITDGSYVGNKANDAKALGLRVVTQGEYEKLLKYRQPAVNLD